MEALLKEVRIERLKGNTYVKVSSPSVEQLSVIAPFHDCSILHDVYHVSIPDC